MDLITWKECFETSYVRVDSQHKYLVNLINELYRNMGAKDKEEQMRYFFMELYHYVLNHFSMEETLMREFNYPDYMAHKNEHAQFIIKIQDFKEKYLTGKEYVNIDLLNFLKDWLLKHIMGTDKKTFGMIKNKSNS